MDPAGFISLPKAFEHWRGPDDKASYDANATKELILQSLRGEKLSKWSKELEERYVQRGREGK